MQAIWHWLIIMLIVFAKERTYHSITVAGPSRYCSTFCLASMSTSGVVPVWLRYSTYIMLKYVLIVIPISYDYCDGCTVNCRYCIWIKDDSCFSEVVFRTINNSQICKPSDRDKIKDHTITWPDKHKTRQKCPHSTSNVEGQLMILH